VSGASEGVIVTTTAGRMRISEHVPLTESMTVDRAHRGVLEHDQADHQDVDAEHEVAGLVSVLAKPLQVQPVGEELARRYHTG